MKVKNYTLLFVSVVDFENISSRFFGNWWRTGKWKNKLNWLDEMAGDFSIINSLSIKVMFQIHITWIRGKYNYSTAKPQQFLRMRKKFKSAFYAFTKKIFSFLFSAIFPKKKKIVFIILLMIFLLLAWYYYYNSYQFSYI